MITLDLALMNIEDLMSSSYHKRFEGSVLRTNTQENLEYIKANAEMMLTLYKNKKFIQEDALDIISKFETIAVNDEKFKNRSCFRKSIVNNNCLYQCDIEKLLENIDIALTRLAENYVEEGNKLSIADLSEKYRYKYLVFDGYEEGEKIIFVKDIHMYNNMLTVDGTIIDICNENHERGDGVLIYEVDNYDFSNFWYFECYDNPDELDKALQSPPVNTSYETHVITPHEVASIILHAIAWTIDYKTQTKVLTGIFNHIVNYWDDKKYNHFLVEQ